MSVNLSELFPPSGSSSGGDVDCNIDVSENPPAPPYEIGQQFFSTSTGREYVWVGSGWAATSVTGGATGDGGSGGDGGGVEEPTDPDFDRVYVLINADDLPDGSQAFVDAANNNTITAVNGARVTTNAANVKHGTGSIDLDSNTGWLSLDVLPDFSYGSATFEWWLKLSSQSDDYQYVYSTGIKLQIFVWKRKLCFYAQPEGSSGYFITMESPDELPTGQWVHCAIQYSGSPNGSYIMFINGVQVTGEQKSGAIGNSTANTIGAYDGGAYPLVGWIDDFRITTKARYSADFTPPDKFPTKQGVKIGRAIEVEVSGEPLFRGDNDADLS